MREIEEQLREIGRRAASLRRRKACRRLILTQCAAVGACLLMIAAAAYGATGLHFSRRAAGTSGYGSAITFGAFAPYVVIGVLAFILGVLVTLLCVRLRKKREDQEKP